MPRHTTACPLDCPDACTLSVEVENGRVVSIHGDRRAPLTEGFICAKVARMGAHLDCPERLLQPLLRCGPKGSGQFRPISWEEALDRATEAIRAASRAQGPQSVLPCSYGGSNGMLSEGGFDVRLFGRLGASRLARTLCAAPSSAAQKGLYGRMPGGALQDVAHAGLILLWGCNPEATSIHLLKQIRVARKAGARLVVVDPVRTRLAADADLHLPVRPGTDLPLALALIHWLFSEGHADEAFLAEHCTGVEGLRERASAWTLDAAAEECGLDVADLRRLGTLWATIRPALVRCGWGPERNRNGGSATAAILALPAVVGAFGQRGGGFQMSSSAAWSFDPAAAADAEEAPTRIINLSRLGQALSPTTQPPIAVLWVYDANPLATCPDQEAVRRGLAREDLFTVVHDAVMTDTARMADLVLPAPVFLEQDDLARGYGGLSLNRLRPVVAAPGEARSNAEVFVAMADRLGLSRPGDVRDAEGLAQRLVAAHPDGARIQADLDATGRAAPPCGEAPLPFVDIWPGTPDRKIHLLPADLDAEAPLGLYRYQPDPGSKKAPLALISPAVAARTSSTFGQLDKGPARLCMHPADAAARKLEDRQQVRIFNELGEVVCGLSIDPSLRPGVVLLPKGLWAHHTTNGATSNALIPQTTADLGGGACYNDARVEVAPADRS